MKLLQAVSRALNILERSLIVLLLAIMVLLAFSQVILRNFFSAGLLWGDPFLRHLVLWIGFLGASLATQQEKHINIDLLTRFASPKIVNIVHIATNLFAGLVCYYLMSAGWTFLQSEMEAHEALFSIGETAFAAWWFQTIIPAGFGLMSFRFFIRTIEHITEAIHPSGRKEFSTNVPTIEI
jgi:TRAP-type C4-dicarboxylate transport system permease small subunit